MILSARRLGALALAVALPAAFVSADVPSATVQPERLFVLTSYCEGVVFDKDGNGYASYDKYIEKFSVDGRHDVWAQTGAPNGHKILADGTHLVCDASQHGVIKLDASGKQIGFGSKECNGKPLRGPNDLTLDTANGGFYFTDPGDSSLENLIGTVHYVDGQGATHLIDDALAFPNGIVLRPDGKTLLVAESQKNQILSYEVTGPGKVGEPKVFCKLPAKDASLGQIDNQPDGMCLDVDGNLYVAHYGMRQVQVVSPKGEVVARLPGGNLTTSNVAFGGPNHDQLYVTGGLGGEVGWGAVFRLDVKTKGIVILPKSK